MLYPRVTSTGELVNEDQMVSYREHLMQEHRLLFLSGVITGETESHNLLMALASVNSAPIKLVITSPGGDPDSAFLFYDAMRLVGVPVITLGRYCASAAAILLAAGTERYLMPHAKVMLHMVYGQASGNLAEWEIQHKQMSKYQDKMVDILIECGVHRTREEILADIDRDFWLEPEEAIEYGLADKIMDKETLGGWLK